MRFAEVALPTSAPVPESAAAYSLEAVLPDGRLIRSANAAELAALLRALRR